MDTVPKPPEDPTVEVLITASWSLPASLAEPWVKYLQMRWESPSLKQSAMQVVHSVAMAPMGQLPELKVEIVQPGNTRTTLTAVELEALRQHFLGE